MGAVISSVSLQHEPNNKVYTLDEVNANSMNELNQIISNTFIFVAR